MTIVYYRQRRKRPAKPAQVIEVPRIVQHTPKGRAWKVLPPDPEAEARVADFFARMMRPVGGT